MIKKGIQEILEYLYREHDRKASLSDDPLFFVHLFKEKEEREIAGLIASSLAYGNRQMIMNSVRNVLERLKPSPGRFVRSCEPRLFPEIFRGFKHRFTRGRDIADLIFFIKQMIERTGSIEDFFMEGYAADKGIENALVSFSERTLSLHRLQKLGRASGFGKGNMPAEGKAGVRFFFPSPQNGSPCKRINLFLRWMVRKDNLDLGMWNRISRSELIIPVDTHILDVARRLRLTKRKNASWKMAIEITDSLKRFDANDPVKYDFALSHGRTVLSLCTGGDFSVSSREGVCS